MVAVAVVVRRWRRRWRRRTRLELHCECWRRRAATVAARRCGRLRVGGTQPTLRRRCYPAGRGTMAGTKALRRADGTIGQSSGSATDCCCCRLSCCCCRPSSVKASAQTRTDPSGLCSHSGPVEAAAKRDLDTRDAADDASRRIAALAPRDEKMSKRAHGTRVRQRRKRHSSGGGAACYCVEWHTTRDLVRGKVRAPPGREQGSQTPGPDAHAAGSARSKKRGSVNQSKKPRDAAVKTTSRGLHVPRTKAKNPKRGCFFSHGSPPLGGGALRPMPASSSRSSLSFSLLLSLSRSLFFLSLSLTHAYRKLKRKG